MMSPMLVCDIREAGNISKSLPVYNDVTTLISCASPYLISSKVLIRFDIFLFFSLAYNLSFFICLCLSVVLKGETQAHLTFAI